MCSWTRSWAAPFPRQYIPAVEKGIGEAMVNGVLAGYPMVDVKVRLVDGSFHAVDSSEMAFKVAGSLGFKKGAAQCKPTLLEPIMLLTVTVPEDAMGDVMGDISSRRGRVLGMDAKGSLQVISAQVPMSEVLTYQVELTSMTGGRGRLHHGAGPLRGSARRRPGQNRGGLRESQGGRQLGTKPPS